MSMTRPISQVIVYSGHHQHPEFGPYYDNIQKRVDAFELLNAYRQEAGREPWGVKQVPGEELEEVLSTEDPKETLLVIPAGPASRLERVFSENQVEFIKDFLAMGGRAYLTCGASYWVSKTRVYKEVCLENPGTPIEMVKKSTMPIFQGMSIGPLCPFPGVKYKVGFYSDAVRISSGNEECTIYLSGGGSFVLDPENGEQRVKVVARYPREELLRLKVREDEMEEKENAAIMVSFGEGAALLAMFHPYYSSDDIDVERYESAFPDCGTNWREVHTKISPVDERMRFVFHQMLLHLEDMRF